MNTEKKNQSNKRWKEKHKEHKKEYDKNCQREYQRDYRRREEPRKKINVRQRTEYLVKNNLLLKDKCQFCDSSENLEIHHRTYNNPEINDLIILCQGCHKALHIEQNRKGGQS
jgi:hypothetical protein